MGRVEGGSGGRSACDGDDLAREAAVGWRYRGAVISVDSAARVPETVAAADAFARWRECDDRSRDTIASRSVRLENEDDLRRGTKSAPMSPSRKLCGCPVGVAATGCGGTTVTRPGDGALLGLTGSIAAVVGVESETEAAVEVEAVAGAAAAGAVAAVEAVAAVLAEGEPRTERSARRTASSVALRHEASVAAGADATAAGAGPAVRRASSLAATAVLVVAPPRRPSAIQIAHVSWL